VEAKKKSREKQRQATTSNFFGHCTCGFFNAAICTTPGQTLASSFLFCQIERTRTTTTSIIIIKGLKTLSLWRQIEVTQLEIKCDSAEQFHNQMGTICSAYPGISWFLSGKYIELFESGDCYTVIQEETFFILFIRCFCLIKKTINLA